MQQEKYYTTVLGGDQSYWEETSAKTIAGAKRVATRRHGAAVTIRGSVIAVGIDAYHGFADSEIYTVTTKDIRQGAQWKMT